MESVITTQVLGVTSRTVGQGRTIYEVQAADGNKYATFKSEIAQKAANLQGQSASLLVKIEQKNGYTNFYINDAGPVGSIAAPDASGGAGVIQTAGQIAPQGGGTITPIQGGGGGGMTPEDKLRISRMSASSTAFGFVGSLFQGAGPEALAEALKMARGLTEGVLQYGTSGFWPGGVQVTALDVPGPETPQEIAAVVPGVQVGVEGVVAGGGGDDIPWD